MESSNSNILPTSGALPEADVTIHDRTSEANRTVICGVESDMGVPVTTLRGEKVLNADTPLDQLLVRVGSVPMRASVALALGHLVKTADGKLAYATPEQQQQAPHAGAFSAEMPHHSAMTGFVETLVGHIGESGTMQLIANVLGNKQSPEATIVAQKSGVSHAQITESCANGIQHVVSFVAQQFGHDRNDVAEYITSGKVTPSRVSALIAATLAGMPTKDRWAAVLAPLADHRLRTSNVRVPSNAVIKDSAGNEFLKCVIDGRTVTVSRAYAIRNGLL